MLCQICNKNLALVTARLGKHLISICIPCGIDLLEDDKDIRLELEKRGIGGKEQTLLEEGNQEKSELDMPSMRKEGDEQDT